jgi:hypothetical protein
MNNDNLPEDFANILHERSRQSAVQQRNLLILLSSGSIAVFFHTLTKNITPPLTLFEKQLIFISLFFMCLCVFSGIISFHSDAKRNYYWAKAINSTEPDIITELKEKRDFWRKIYSRTQEGMTFGFVFGIFSAIG